MKTKNYQLYYQFYQLSIQKMTSQEQGHIRNEWRFAEIARRMKSVRLLIELR